MIYVTNNANVFQAAGTEVWVCGIFLPIHSNKFSGSVQNTHT